MSLAWPMVKAGYGSMFTGGGRMFKPAILPVALFLAVDWMLHWLRMRFLGTSAMIEPSTGMTGLLVFEFLGYLKFVCLTPLLVCWHRWVLLGEPPVGFWGGTKPVRKNYLRHAAVILFTFSLFLMLPFFAWFLSGSAGERLNAAVVVIVPALAGIYLAGRLSLALPSSALAVEGGLKGSWKATTGYVPGLIGGVLMLAALPVCLYGFIWLLLYGAVLASFSVASGDLGAKLLHASRLAVFLLAPVSICLVMLLCAGVSEAYRRILGVDTSPETVAAFD